MISINYSRWLFSLSFINETIYVNKDMPQLPNFVSFLKFRFLFSVLSTFEVWYDSRSLQDT